MGGWVDCACVCECVGMCVEYGCMGVSIQELPALQREVAGVVMRYFEQRSVVHV